MTRTSTSNESAQRLPIALRPSIPIIKENVSIEEFLQAYDVEVNRNRARCIVHGGDNPQSFSIDPERGNWRCHACGEFGDIIDLCQAVEGGEKWEAVQLLADRFDIQLPIKSDRWHERQNKKGVVREQVKHALAKRYQRKLYRIYAPAISSASEDEAREFFVDLYTPALLLADQRLS